MEKVKAGLRGMVPTAKVSLGNGVVMQMNMNPHFPNPTPSLAELQAACDELGQACVDALDGGRTACHRKRVATTKLDRILSALASYVNSKAPGDVEKLISSGFPLAKQPSPINALEQPMIKVFKHTQWENKVNMMWNSIPGALVYLVERSSDTQKGEWSIAVITSKLSWLVERSANGGMFNYRVCAIGSSGQGPYSNVKQPKAA